MAVFGLIPQEMRLWTAVRFRFRFIFERSRLERCLPAILTANRYSATDAHLIMRQSIQFFCAMSRPFLAPGHLGPVLGHFIPSLFLTAFAWHVQECIFHGSTSVLTCSVIGAKPHIGTCPSRCSHTLLSAANVAGCTSAGLGGMSSFGNLRSISGIMRIKSSIVNS